MTKNPKTAKRTLIGWKEWCALPDLGLPAVKAKIDTGAETSALHAYDIETFIHHNIPYVRFKSHPLQRDGGPELACEAPLVEKRIVVSSNGEREMRPVILTRIGIGEIFIHAELTLTSRHKMNFRMLLGRKALKQAKVIVAPGKSFLLGKIENPAHLYARAKKGKN